MVIFKARMIAIGDEKVIGLLVGLLSQSLIGLLIEIIVWLVSAYSLIEYLLYC